MLKYEDPQEIFGTRDFRSRKRKRCPFTAAGIKAD